jgi:hypothetical protein
MDCGIGAKSTMGFNNIQLLSEHGRVEDETCDQRNWLAHWIEKLPELESTHCLQYLNPYGDTVLNTLQIPRFLVEWRIIEGQANTPEEVAFVSEVRRLAALCGKGSHLYLKFWGD